MYKKVSHNVLTKLTIYAKIMVQKNFYGKGESSRKNNDNKRYFAACNIRGITPICFCIAIFFALYVSDVIRSVFEMYGIFE